MEHFIPHHFHGPQATIPAPLMSFLQELGATQTSDETWACLTRLGVALGFRQLAYIQSSNDLEEAQETPKPWRIRSTVENPSHRCIVDSPTVQRMARTGGASQALAPYFIHIRDPLLPEGSHRAQLAMLDALGMSVGIAIPVISGDAADKAMIIFGSNMPAEEFMMQIERFGCGVHMAAMAAHARYSALYKQEFIDRARLTEKQAELIRLVGLGLLDKQIAHQLGISFSAVRQRLAAVQQKTCARNRAHLAAMAMRINLTADPLMAPSKIAAE